MVRGLATWKRFRFDWRGMFTHKSARFVMGAKGQGGPQDRLTGGIGTLASAKPIKTPVAYWPSATTIFDYVRRAMPLQSPESLTNDEVYALTAYILVDRWGRSTRCGARCQIAASGKNAESRRLRALVARTQALNTN